MGQNFFAGCNSHKRSVTDCLCTRLMPGISVMEESLYKHGSDIGGTRIRDEGANLGPGAVSANQKLSGCCRTVGKGQQMFAATQSGSGFELVPPADCIGRQRLHEHLAEVSPVNLR